ncbi:MAG: Vacuolar morphogenesis protein 6 [Watsoniomyces obsoletus]|nr:MAG: Vacuolar morphogenesis protein 6 [Watsoniomyces obsoletus]
MNIISLAAAGGSRGPGRPAEAPPKPPPLRRADSSSSDSSASSQVTTVSVKKRPEQNTAPDAKQPSRRPALHTAETHIGSTASHNYSRPGAARVQFQSVSGTSSPTGGPMRSHQSPQHTQGFFEPSVSRTSSPGQAPANHLSASQAAAQAAMQHQSAQQQHSRQRSLTVPTPHSPVETSSGGRSPTPGQASAGVTQTGGPKRPNHPNALNGSYTAAAATAANAAYPRSASSAGLLSSPERALPGPEKESKPKPERSKMKLFSKPKSIGISRDKEAEKKERPLPSPNKMGIYGPSPLPHMFTASTTSLADSASSGPPPSSLYSIRNNSTATLLPSSEPTASEKPKHHNFLSRQKLKLREKDDTHHHLSLASSAFSSKSSHISPGPPSPGHMSTSFAKTVSGLDIRHGGRALREKKREEKATAAAISRDEDSAYGAGDGAWPGTLHMGASTTTVGQGSYKAGSVSLASGGGGGASGSTIDGLAPINLHGFGLVGMTPDDAWPYLKAKLLVIFEGEMLRIPVEDCNKLVLAHIQRCVQARAPNFIMDDLQDLLHTGFSSLNQTLRRNSEERLVPNLAQLWLVVFGSILPYLQAVFLPLDLEFKGTGCILSPRDAQEFWGALPDNGSSETDTPLGDLFDVRRIVLVSFRDTVILSRYSRLQAVFSRLSLESINGPLDVLGTSPESGSGGRPDTAASLDPGFASYNSQSSTLLNESGGSMGARSRATSNTSSSALGGGGGTGTGTGTGTHSLDPEPLPSSMPSPSTKMQTTSAPPLPPPQQHHPTLLGSGYPDPADSARVTETVGRMLQCVSVLADLKTRDDAQVKMEELAKSMKHNWLGRGRTGRNRKGFVGMKLTGPKGKL